jgi:hypothetical protein
VGTMTPIRLRRKVKMAVSFCDHVWRYFSRIPLRFPKQPAPSP